MIRRLVSFTAGALTLSFVASASAHIVMSAPPARDFGKAGADAHKTGPCGGIARTGTYTQYAVGQTVNVEFTETIDHRGCFQVLLSDANDANFQILTQVNDPAGDVTPKKNTLSVTLPAGKTCQACTLAVRQLMINKACVANQASIAAGDTYFTCSDVCIGTTCPPKTDAGAPGPSDASAPVDDGGRSPGPDAGAPGPTPTATATGTPAPTSTTPATAAPTDADGGCSTSPLAAGGAGGMGLLAMGAAVVAVARRRARHARRA
jgi:hypothetical protein